MERIKFYFPRAKRLTKTHFSILTKEECYQLLLDIPDDADIGNMSNRRNICQYLVKFHLDDLKWKEKRKVLWLVKTLPKRIKLARQQVKVIEKEPESKPVPVPIESKQEIKEITEKKVKKKKAEEGFFYFIIDETKTYKIKISEKYLCVLYEISSRINGNSGKFITSASLDEKKILEEINSIMYLENFRFLMGEKKIEKQAFNDFLPCYIYLIARSFGIKASEISQIEVKKEIDKTIYHVFYPGNSISFYPKMDDRYFYNSFHVRDTGGKSHFAVYSPSA